MLCGADFIIIITVLGILPRDNTWTVKIRQHSSPQDHFIISESRQNPKVNAVLLQTYSRGEIQLGLLVKKP